MSNTNVPQSGPDVKIERVDSLAVEDRLIDAVVRFYHARTDAQDVGRICMEMENRWRKGGTTDHSSYIEQMMKYRAALAEMSAARYELVLLLGW